METQSIKLMTKGSIWKNILTFAIPIFLGNLFQQLYNAVDSVVVGNYVGKEALAAVTSCGPLIFLLVGFFIGTFIGVGVIISKYFGAEDMNNVSKSVHTAVAFALLCSVLLTLIGYISTPLILRMMGTPSSVYEDAKTYIQIYFLGISSLILYNSASGILQAMGDSKHPLYFLIIASITNIILDLLFVIVFKWGVAGVAYATILGQSISSILSFRILFTTKEAYRVTFKKISFDLNILKQMLKVGIPSGLQNSVISVANIVVQASVNSFGAIAMAGCGAFSRIQGFVFIPITSFALALTTFTSQNIGAGKYDRVKKGTKFGILSAMILAELIGVILYIFTPSLLGLFTKDIHVIEIGIVYAKFICPFLLFLALSHAMAGVYRGAGKSIVPMVVMFLIWCVFRVSYITIALKFKRDIRFLYSAYPITWFLSSIVFVIYYFTVDWMGLKAHKINEVKKIETT